MQARCQARRECGQVQYRPDPVGGRCFLPRYLCFFPYLLHTTWQRDLLERQVIWSYCLPAETCQGVPIALRKKARLFTQLFKALLVCPQPTLAGYQKISPGSFCCSRCSHTNLVSWLCVADLSHRALGRVVLTLWNILSPAYLHNTWIYLLLHHHCFSGKPAPSPPELCSFLSEHFSRIMMTHSLVRLLDQCLFPSALQVHKTRACLSLVTIASPVCSLVSGTQYVLNKCWLS